MIQGPGLIDVGTMAVSTDRVNLSRSWIDRRWYNEHIPVDTLIVSMFQGPGLIDVSTMTVSPLSGGPGSKISLEGLILNETEGGRREDHHEISLKKKKKKQNFLTHK